MKVTVTKKEHEDLEMFLKMLGTDREFSLNHRSPEVENETSEEVVTKKVTT